MSVTNEDFSYGLVYTLTTIDEIRTHPGNPIVKDKTTTTVTNQPVGKIGSLHRAGTVTPGFAEKLASGTLKPNPFQFSRTTWQPRSGAKKRELTRYQNTPNYTYTETITTRGCLSATQSVNGVNAQAPSLLVTNAVRYSEGQALSRVKNQDANLAEAFAERHKSIDMIGSAAKNIGESYRALRRGNFLQAANVLGIGRPSGGHLHGVPRGKRLADAWLEYRYGWMPLILDAYGAVAALHRSFSPGHNETCRATGSSTLKNTTTSVPTSIDFGSGKSVLTRSYDVQVKTILYYRRSSNTLATLSALGLDNPLALGWELLPYSFVVDWFLGIGQFLSNLSAGFGYEFESGCTTVFHKATETKDFVWNGSEGGLNPYWATGQAVESASVITCNRTLVPYFPVFTLPAFGNGLSLKRALDAISLLSQLRGK